VVLFVLKAIVLSCHNIADTHCYVRIPFGVDFG